MAPVRIELAIELARAFGLFGRAGVSVESPAPATDVQLQMVHIRRYIATVRRASGLDLDPSILSFGLGTEDDPVFSGMHPATLWPGTGLPSETGGPGAEGSAANVALPARTRNAGWLRVFHAVVPPLLRAFRPEILVSQHGCNTHWLDPLADLQLSWMRSAQRTPRSTAWPTRSRASAGFLRGGGYELLHVVPRTWTHLLAEAAGYPINPEARIPAGWREYALRRTGRQAPELMTEGARAQYTRFESGYDPAGPVDQAIMATRTAVFPEHGLMPMS